MIWVAAEVTIPSIGDRARLAIAINMMVNSLSCSGLILWYLERGRSHDQHRDQAARDDRDRMIKEVAALVYAVAFADGADEERNSREIEDALQRIVILDEHRDHDSHAPRGYSNGSR